MSSSLCEHHSRKRPIAAWKLNGEEDDDDSDIEIIPFKQPRKNSHASNVSFLKENLINMLHWMKSTSMFQSFITSALKALGYREGSDEFEEIESERTLPRSSVPHEQRENGYSTSSPKEVIGSFKSVTLPSFSCQKPHALSFGKNSMSVRSHSKVEEKHPLTSTAECTRFKKHRFFSDDSRRHNRIEWSSKINGHSPCSTSLHHRFSYSSPKRGEANGILRETKDPQKFIMKLLDHSDLIKDRSSVPLRKKKVCSDVEIVDEVLAPDVLISRTKLVVRSNDTSPRKAATAHSHTVFVPSSNGVSKFTTNTMLNHQEKEIYKMLLDNYFALGSWEKRTSIQQPTYRSTQVQVNFEDINTPSVEKYVERYLPKNTAVRKSQLQKSPFPRAVFKPRTPEDEVIFLGEKPFRFKEKPRKKMSMPTAPVFTKEWIDQLRKSLEEETEERLKIVAEQNRQIENCRKKVREQLKSGVPVESIIIDATDEFPELSSEMNCIIDNVLMKPSTEKFVSKIGTLEVTWKDVDTLNNRNWLNDNVISFYLALVTERSKQPGYPSVYDLNSFFYTNLKTKGYSTIKRWTRKVDIFSYDMIIVPLHLGLHWALAVIDFRHKTIRYYDSMSGQEDCLELLRDYLVEESKDKRKVTYDTSDWSLEIMKDIPQQMNGYDCGMFTLKYAEYITRDAPLTFTQQNMPYFRRKMVYEIMTKQII